MRCRREGPRASEEAGVRGARRGGEAEGRSGGSGACCMGARRVRLLSDCHAHLLKFSLKRPNLWLTLNLATLNLIAVPHPHPTSQTRAIHQAGTTRPLALLAARTACGRPRWTRACLTTAPRAGSSAAVRKSTRACGELILSGVMLAGAALVGRVLALCACWWRHGEGADRQAVVCVPDCCAARCQPHAFSAHRATMQGGAPLLNF